MSKRTKERKVKMKQIDYDKRDTLVRGVRDNLADITRSASFLRQAIYRNLSDTVLVDILADCLSEMQSAFDRFHASVEKWGQQK